MESNYQKAIQIYEAGGQAAVEQAVLTGLLEADRWEYCLSCESVEPMHDDACLVCGSGGVDDDDCQPDEYTEWQDYMGGDDWDHGQYDQEYE